MDALAKLALAWKFAVQQFVLLVCLLIVLVDENDWFCIAARPGSCSKVSLLYSC